VWPTKSNVGQKTYALVASCWKALDWFHETSMCSAWSAFAKAFRPCNWKAPGEWCGSRNTRRRRRDSGLPYSSSVPFEWKHQLAFGVTGSFPLEFLLIMVSLVTRASQSPTRSRRVVHASVAEWWCKVCDAAWMTFSSCNGSAALIGPQLLEPFSQRHRVSSLTSAV